MNNPLYNILPALRQKVDKNEGVQKIKSWLEQPAPQKPAQFLENIFNSKNTAIRVPMKVGEGVLESGMLGLADVPVRPSETKLESAAYLSGALAPILASLTTGNTGAASMTPMGLMNKIGVAGEKAATIKTLPPFLQNLVKTAGGNLAQTAAYGAAANAAGQQFNPTTDFLQGMLFSTPQLKSVSSMNIKAKNPLDLLFEEAKKYKSAEEFVKAQPKLYHGTSANLKKFSNKQGTFFTDDFMNADGYAAGENVYEGYLNLKRPLVIDAKGRMHNDLKTPFGKTTREVVDNVDTKEYDGVVFKNIKDSWIDDADAQDPSTIYYAFKPRDAFLNEDQLSDLWNQAHQSTSTPKSGKVTKLFHGTDKQFDEFDITKSADGSIWFTDNQLDITDPSRGVAATGKGRIVERILPDNLKLADEDLIDKYSVDELINMGYDGVKYPPSEKEGSWYQIFNPEKLLKETPQPTSDLWNKANNKR